MTILVIPDTNILYSDPFLEKPLVKTIIAAEERADLRLMIPAVVVDELRNKVVERLEKATSDGKKVGREFVNLSGLTEHEIKFHINNREQKAVLDRFEQRVEELAQEGRILDYPIISPEQLAQRSIRRQRPFQDKDRGMRDTLAWLNIKEYLRSNPGSDTKMLLVSSDDKAFFESGKDELHESLKKELDDERIPRDSVIVRRDLNRAITEFISDRLASADSVKCAIEGNRIKDFTYRDDTVALMAQDWMFEHPSEFEDPYIATNYLGVEFDGLEGVVLEDVEETLVLGSGQVSVDLYGLGKRASSES